MFILTALPETIPVPLDDAGLPGVVAHVRPLDDVDLAKWLDLYPPGSHQDYLATVMLARKQLAAVDGVTFATAEGADPVPFDVTNAVHVRELLRQRQSKAVAALLADAVMLRATLTEPQAGKSDSPSDSHRAPNGGTSPAAAAMTNGETRTVVDSPKAAASPASPSPSSSSDTVGSTRRGGARGRTSQPSPLSGGSSGVTTS